MRMLILFILLFLVPILTFADAPDNRDITSQVSEILKECSEIKPGTSTRADLIKYFTTEGGIWDSSQRTYVSRRCPYVKVDVKFSLTKPDQKFTDELATDTVQSISKPYLELSISD
jgi:hypothetical protein